MSCITVAQMLSTTFFYKRFFPYYICNILAGLDNEGKGCVYSFDPVGSYEQETYHAGDHQCQCYNISWTIILDARMSLDSITDKDPITRENVVSLVKDIVISAAERVILTGDGLKMHAMSADRIETVLIGLSCVIVTGSWKTYLLGTSKL